MTRRARLVFRDEIANLFTDEWDEEQEHEGFRIRKTQIGPRLGAELIGGSVYEIDPGKKLWPYHLHLGFGYPLHFAEQGVTARPQTLLPAPQKRLASSAITKSEKSHSVFYLAARALLLVLLVAGVVRWRTHRSNR